MEMDEIDEEEEHVVEVATEKDLEGPENCGLSFQPTQLRAQENFGLCPSSTRN